MVPAMAQRDEKRVLALFLLKTATVSKVSKNALDTLIGDISVLLEGRVQLLQEDISTALRHRGVEFDAELAAIFQKSHLIAPFKGLHSEFLRKKFYREKMSLLVSVQNSVYQELMSLRCIYTSTTPMAMSTHCQNYIEEPVERKLGLTVIETTRNLCPYFQKKADYSYEVPLLCSLKQLLSDPFILEEVRACTCINVYSIIKINVVCIY